METNGQCRLRFGIAEFETRTDASCVRHNMSNVILFVDALEHVSLGTNGEDAHVVSAVSLRSQRHGGGLFEIVSTCKIV